LQSFFDEQQNNSPNNPFGNRMKITWAVFNPFICIFQPRITLIYTNSDFILSNFSNFKNASTFVREI